MKKIVILLLLTASFSNLYSQLPQGSEICFEYDQSGNRIHRNLCPLNPIRNGENAATVYTDKSNNVSLYPNPTLGHVSIKISEIAVDQKTEIRVYANSGELILKKEGNYSEYEIDLSNFSQGIYNCNIYINDKPSLWRIIKQ